MPNCFSFTNVTYPLDVSGTRRVLLALSTSRMCMQGIHVIELLLDLVPGTLDYGSTGTWYPYYVTRTLCCSLSLTMTGESSMCSIYLTKSDTVWHISTYILLLVPASCSSKKNRKMSVGRREGDSVFSITPVELPQRTVPGTRKKKTFYRRTTVQGTLLRTQPRRESWC